MADSNTSKIDARLFKSISGLSDNQKKELLRLVNALQHERRQHHRKKHLAGVNYATENRSVSGTIHNISSHGMYIEPQGPFAIGRTITLSFEHPVDKKPVKVVGKIVRKEQDGIGVQFIDTHDDL